MTIRKTMDKTGDSFLPSRLAILIDTEPSPFELDPELRKIQSLVIDPNPKNREIAFYMESVAVSFTSMTIATIIGDGVRPRLDNKEALKIVKHWNRCINVKRQSVEDYMEDSWFDTIMHAKSFYRVIPDNPEYENVDIQRMDPKTIEIREDPALGWRQFVQHIGKFKYYRKKAQFYRKGGEDSRKYIAVDTDKINYGPDLVHYNTVTQNMEVFIPDEPNRILFTNFFKKAPIATAIKYIVYKAWILWFMRKYSQKYWAPFIIAKVGDPARNNYPTDPAIMQKSIEKVSAIVRNMTNFGYLTVPGDVDIKTLETGTAKSAEIYPMYIGELDKQIMYAIFGSMGQREASGNELATSRTLQEMWLRFAKAVRRKYELVLTYFYSKCLLPYNGITTVEPEDFDFDWSRLRVEEPKELMESINIGYQMGLWKDKNEMRKAAQSVFAFLEEIEGSEGTTLPNPPITQKPEPTNQKLEKLYENYVRSK